MPKPATAAAKWKSADASASDFVRVGHRERQQLARVAVGLLVAELHRQQLVARGRRSLGAAGCWYFSGSTPGTFGLLARPATIS